MGLATNAGTPVVGRRGMSASTKGRNAFFFALCPPSTGTSPPGVGGGETPLNTASQTWREATRKFRVRCTEKKLRRAEITHRLGVEISHSILAGLLICTWHRWGWGGYCLRGDKRAKARQHRMTNDQLVVRTQHHRDATLRARGNGQGAMRFAFLHGPAHPMAPPK